MEISLSHTIAMGHRIPGHENGMGKCARLHGHTYRFDVMAKSPILRDGFVIDFGVIKNALNEWDHRTILWDQDPDLNFARFPAANSVGILYVPFIPTAEAIAMFWADCLFRELRIYHDVEYEDLPEEQEEYAIMVEVWESPTTSARYIRR